MGEAKRRRARERVNARQASCSWDADGAPTVEDPSDPNLRRGYVSLRDQALQRLRATPARDVLDEVVLARLENEKREEFLRAEAEEERLALERQQNRTAPRLRGGGTGLAAIACFLGAVGVGAPFTARSGRSFR